MAFLYKTRGTCSRNIILEMDGDIIKDVEFIGGCGGRLNQNPAPALGRGQRAQDVIARVRGIHCGSKPTSCPDQLAYALQAYLNQR